MRRIDLGAVAASAPHWTSSTEGSSWMAGKRWQDRPPGVRWALIALGAVEVTLGATAWTDLARRPAERVNGPKPLWAAIIALNIVGPLAYFRWGRR
jgi:hypothetical protein